MKDVEINEDDRHFSLNLTDHNLYSYKVYVASEPQVKTVIADKGPHAGREIAALSFRAYKRNFNRYEDGTFEQLKPTWLSVVYRGSAALELKNLIRLGMALRLDGELVTKTQSASKAEQGSERVFEAEHLALDLIQSGLLGIDYVKGKKRVTELHYTAPVKDLRAYAPSQEGSSKKPEGSLERD